jgi:hypothetical protein
MKDRIHIHTLTLGMALIGLALRAACRMRPAPSKSSLILPAVMLDFRAANPVEIKDWRSIGPSCLHPTQPLFGSELRIWAENQGLDKDHLGALGQERPLRLKAPTTDKAIGFLYNPDADKQPVGIGEFHD